MNSQSEPVVLSARAVDRFVPADAPGIAYLLRCPGRLDRALWRRDVTAAGAPAASENQLNAAIDRAIDDIAPPNADLLRGIVSTWRYASQRMAPDDPAYRAAGRDMDALEATLIGLDPRIATAKAALDLWRDLAPYYACRRFLIGAEGVAVDLTRGADGLLPEAALAALPEGHADAIGWRAMTLMAPGPAQTKN